MLPAAAIDCQMARVFVERVPLHPFVIGVRLPLYVIGLRTSVKSWTALTPVVPVTTVETVTPEVGVRFVPLATMLACAAPARLPVKVTVKYSPVTPETEQLPEPIDDSPCRALWIVAIEAL